MNVGDTSVEGHEYIAVGWCGQETVSSLPQLWLRDDFSTYSWELKETSWVGTRSVNAKPALYHRAMPPLKNIHEKNRTSTHTHNHIYRYKHLDKYHTCTRHAVGQIIRSALIPRRHWSWRSSSSQSCLGRGWRWRQRSWPRCRPQLRRRWFRWDRHVPIRAEFWYGKVMEDMSLTDVLYLFWVSL